MRSKRYIPAEKGHARTIVALLKSADLPCDDIDLSWQEFIIAERDGSVIGVVGLERLGECALLRSLAVDVSCRGKGTGRVLVEEAICFARAKGVREVYLLTMTADLFFEKLGFARIDRLAVPETVRNTTEFRSICPSSSACLKKEL